MDTLRDIIYAYKPKNRPITNDTYINRLKKLMESNVQLDDPQQVEQYLQKLAFKTRRSYYIALNVYFKAKGVPNEIYEKKIKSMGETIEMEDDKNENSGNLVDRKEIDTVILDIKKGINILKSNKNMKYFRRLQDLLIINLYSIIPPVRNDYINTYVYETMPLYTNKEYNYILLKDKQFVLNRYKTDRKYGTKIIDLPDSLVELIKNVLDERKEIFPSLYNEKALLINNNKEQMTKTNLIHNLNVIFRRKVSVTVLRKSYVSNKYPVIHTMEEMKKDADLMGHSVKLQQSTYRKKI